MIRKSKGSVPPDRDEQQMDLGIYLVLIGKEGREQLLTYLRVRNERECAVERQRPREAS